MGNTKERVFINREQFRRCSGNYVRVGLLSSFSCRCDENDIIRVSLRQAAQGLPARKRNKRRIGRTLRWMEKEGMIILKHPIKYKGLNEIKVTNLYEDIHESNSIPLLILES